MEREVNEKENDEQESKMRYCPYCKALSRFVQTTCPSGKWVCTNAECFGYTCSSEKVNMLELTDTQKIDLYPRKRRNWIW